MAIPKLYDYQEKAVNEIRAHYSQGSKAVLFALPTGGGKTVTFSHIAHNAEQKNKKILINVHRVELLRQSAKTLRSFGLRVGLVSPKYTPDFNAPIQVAMVQTMRNRRHLYKHFDLIITDECHHAAADTYKEVYSSYPSAYHLGVTATPCRSDGLGLGIESGGIYTSMVLGPSTRDLINRGKLCDFDYYGAQALDLSGINRRMGDFNKRQLNERVDKPHLIGDAVQHYLSVCPGVPAVAFCVSIDHAENVAAQFRSEGLRAYAVSGKTDDLTRDRILNGLGNGSVDVVCSCDIISEGTDIPAITAAILLRPTQSLGLYIQQVGRALRTKEGKDKAIVLDHANNWITHGGFPDEKTDWTLKGEKMTKRDFEKAQEERPQSVYQCKNCFAVFKPFLNICPNCKTVREIKSRDLKQVDGKLEKITKEEMAAVAREKRREVSNARTLEDLEKIAKERGYKAGWALHKFRAREKAREKYQGNFPRKEDEPIIQKKLWN